MQTQIFLPLDGSPLAETIIPHVIPLARAYKSTVTLLTVIAPPMFIGPYGIVVSLTEAQQKGLELQARNYLEKAAHPLIAQGLPIHLKVLTGDPALSIAGYVEQVAGMRLLAMAAHGHGELYRLIRSSVAEKVGHLISLPVLVLIPHQGMHTQSHPVSYRKILVLLDDEVSSEQSLRTARQLASRVGAQLIEVSTAPASDHLVSVSAASASSRASQWESEFSSTYPQVLTPIRQTLENWTRTDGASGRTVENLLHIIADQQPDLLVMALPRPSSIQRLFPGNVATKVIRKAAIPTLLV
ncbi:MAG TPA: universal stress protein [Ktedonobacteraceae bacterium]|nr:universal stress protein [Ktedonobacteraceae bacterium]